MDSPAQSGTEIFCENGWNGRKVILPPAPSFLDKSQKMWLMPNPLSPCSTQKDVFDVDQPTIEWCAERKFLLKIPSREGLYMGEIMRADFFYQHHVVRASVPNRELVQHLLCEARRCIKLNIRQLRTVCVYGIIPQSDGNLLRSAVT